MFKEISLAAAIFLAASAAQAQGYIGASVGQSELQEDCAGPITCDFKDTGFKVFGGHMFTQHFGLEVGYVDLGQARIAFPVGALLVNADLKSSGFGAWAKAALPINNFSLFGKIGFAYLESEVTATAAGLGSASESESNANVAWGVGASYSFTKNFGARVEYERFRLELQGEKSDVDLLSAGLIYRF